MQVRTIYNIFGRYIDNIYLLCKKLKYYTQEEYNQTFNENQTWPGLRTENFHTSNPLFLNTFLLNLEKNNLNLNKYRTFSAYCHLRFEEDEKNDWIHSDEGDTIIIYLSPTNLQSGTEFYSDDEKHMIATNKFIQNTCLFFEEGIKHKSFGNHGNNIDNARMTLNMWMK